MGNVKIAKSKIEIGFQTGSSNTLYARWSDWGKNSNGSYNKNRQNTKDYKVIWKYYTGDGFGYVGVNKQSTSNLTQSTYSVPENAKKVTFSVKPIPKTTKKNKKDVDLYTSEWSEAKEYKLSSNPPSTPPTPSCSMVGNVLTMSLTNLDVNADYIIFRVRVLDGGLHGTYPVKIAQKEAGISVEVKGGKKYLVDCKASDNTLGGEESSWSEYTVVECTALSGKPEILELRALSETSVYMDWKKVTNSTQYRIQYTTHKSYFDSNQGEVKEPPDTIKDGKSHSEVTGLESGNNYFFRVRGENDTNDYTPWSDLKSITIGSPPIAPTTWSSASTVIKGDVLTLYWNHNSEDGSKQRGAILQLIIDGVEQEPIELSFNPDADDADKTSSYEIDTSSYSEGCKLEWKVRTRGILPDYGDWSIQRTVNIYEKVSLTLYLVHNSALFETLESFPFFVTAVPGPDTQSPIGYHISIVANESYETIDQLGNEKFISKGDEIYSKYFDVNDDLNVEFRPSDIDLSNGINYTVNCTVSMDSGLTGKNSASFTVAWTDETYDLNAEIGYDEKTLSMMIRPYCVDENEELVEDISLSVYRREFDGAFTELMTGINNTSNIYITDPHPALNYARYRIVGIDNNTGAVSYYDIPGYPTGEIAAVIQWDETWSSLTNPGEDEYEEPTWSGSMVKLPYNLDVSDSYSPDVELIDYIGREHPVSYYGTQIGSTSSWSVEIEKDDEETLYALRRLARWMGDVYIREPSGSGYWANVTVSFSQKHCELTIPVTIDITRVAGGV